jgi:ASC-1-like (ASCH) protein
MPQDTSPFLQEFHWKPMLTQAEILAKFKRCLNSIQQRENEEIRKSVRAGDRGEFSAAALHVSVANGLMIAGKSIKVAIESIEEQMSA